MQTNKGKNLIIDLSFEFALKITRFAELLEHKRKYIIARQLLRSGTSIGASVREAQNAESRNDFIHKMKVAAKETDETEYWLLLCKHTGDYENCELLIDDCISIAKVLSKIIGTTKKANNALK